MNKETKPKKKKNNSVLYSTYDNFRVFYPSLHQQNSTKIFNTNRRITSDARNILIETNKIKQQKQKNSF